MAYTANQLVGMGYQGYTGWGDAEANADFIATKGQGKGGPTSSGNNSTPATAPASTANTIDTAKQVAQFNIAQNQPAIQTLQNEGITVNEQYQNLINQYTTQQKQEYAGRGLNTTDPSVQSAITQGELPFQAQRDVTQAQINNAIGQYQTGDPNQSVQAALTLSQIQQGIPLQQAQANLYGAQANQAQYVPINYQGGLFNTTTQQMAPGANLAALFANNGASGNTTGNTAAPQNGATYVDNNGITHTYVNGQWGVTQ